MDRGIFNLLRSFSRSEIKELKKFVECRCFNSNKNVSVLLDLMTKYFPTIKEEYLKEEKLYQLIYPNTTFRPGTMRNLFHRLHKVIDEFIVVNSARNDKKYRTESLLRRYDRKKLNTQYNVLSEKLKKYYNEKIKLDRKFYYDKSSFLEIEYDHKKRTEKILDRETAIEHSKTLNDSIVYNSSGYLAELILVSLLQDANKEKYSLNKTENKAKTLLKIIKQKEFSDYLKKNIKENFILYLYFLAYNTANHIDNEDYYYEYKKEFMKHAPRLGHFEFSFHNSQLLNYCVLREKDEKNLMKFSLERLSIYKFVIDNNYYKTPVQDFLPENVFRAALLLSYRLGDIPGIRKFISKDVKKISPDMRENMEQFAESYFQYMKGDYDEAENYISYIDYPNFIYRYDVYNLKLKILYDKGDLNAAYHLADNYKHYITNHDELDKERKQMHTRFIKYIVKLIKYNDDKKKLEDAFAGFEGEKNILYKDWLRRRWMKIGKMRSKVKR